MSKEQQSWFDWLKKALKGELGNKKGNNQELMDDLPVIPWFESIGKVTVTED